MGPVEAWTMEMMGAKKKTEVIPLTCGSCQKEFTTRFVWKLKGKTHVDCPHCGNQDVL